ncbi:MAG: PQQ-binding-like beta-propeller repeat protein [Planctomycetes bacterium]|nr:PQQ-binding-like beta-propeller repeat protein [Planctomycetota bacterium]
MSDVKSAEPKAEAPPAAAGAPETKPVEAKAAEAKPAAPAKPEIKAPEAKPAPAKPAPAPVAAAAAAPAGPAPGTVGVRAPVAKTAEQNLQITISAKAIAMIMSALVLIVLILGGTTIFLLVRMTDRGPLSHITPQVPGLDGTMVAAAPKAGGPAAGTNPIPAGEVGSTAPPEALEKVDVGVNFKEGLGGKPSTKPGSWPTFRGPKYDNIVSEVSLANRWPKDGPPIRWSLTDLAHGYSGVAVHAGRVYLQDYDLASKEECLRCFSLEDGKEIWRRSYPLKIVNNHGFTRTVPAVTDKHVVSFGSKCHVLCVDAQTGAKKWGLDLMRDYGSKLPDWYAAQCPIIDGSTVVLAPAGKDVLMMGVDLESGNVVWKTPNPKGLQMSHSSISPMTLNGKKMYVYCAEWGKILGVSAEKDTIGTVLWEETCIDKQVISPSPAVLDDGYIFMTAGYKGGSSLLKVSEEGGKYSAKVLWKLDEVEGLSCEQQTPIYYQKHLFALLPDSSGARKQQLVCMNPYDKGKIVWESGKEKRFGQYESMLLADGKFFILDKDAGLTMVKASTQKYEELGRCRLLKGHEAWAPIALAGNLMILRDEKVLHCLDVGKGIE